MTTRIQATYRIRSEAGAIEERARAVAVEQSVEMPVSAIDDSHILADIVGRVDAIREIEPGRYDVRVALSAETIGNDAGQLVNMLFGNSSIHDDVTLHDVEIPQDFATSFGGPRHGPAELRRRVGAGKRALTCSALKPQGLSPEKLAQLAGRFAKGGIDYIKDDHGIAEQVRAPFAARVPAIQTVLHDVARASGRITKYVPSLSGDLDAMRRQLGVAADAGVDCVLIAPMIAGPSNMQTLVREHPAIAFMTHPTMAGAARIAPPAHFGKLFRLLGADALVFPNFGGRFGYSAETCRDLAHAALADWHGLKPSIPVPAGGMTRERVPELLDFYGADVMLLIGGALLEARDRLAEATAAFVTAVEQHRYS